MPDANIDYGKRTHRRAYTALLALALSVALLAAPAMGQEDQPTAPEPGPVTIQLQAVHPNDVLAALIEQTGVKFNVWPENLWEQYKSSTNAPPTSIDIDVENKPFWVAMQQFCEASKLTPANMGQGEGIALQYQGNRPFGARPVYDGEVASFLVDNIQRSHTLHFEQENSEPQRRCGIELRCYFDPRLRITKYASSCNIESAQNEAGEEIAAASQNTSTQSPSTPWQLNNFFIPLDYDPQSSKMLALLKGSVRATCATEVEKLELDLAEAEGTSQDIAGRTITIDRVKEENNSIDVKIVITRGDMPKEQFRELMHGMFQAINLVSEDGKRRNNSGGGGGGDDKLDYSVQANYSKDEDKPVKIVWEMPTQYEEIDLPFEFKDLPLP